LENGFAVIRSALRQPLHLRALRRCKCAHSSPLWLRPPSGGHPVAAAQGTIHRAPFAVCHKSQSGRQTVTRHVITRWARNQLVQRESGFVAAGAGFASPRTTRNPTFPGPGVQLALTSEGQSALPPITLPLPSRVSTHSATLPPRS